jgi:hypothetical protein
MQTILKLQVTKIVAHQTQTQIKQKGERVYEIALTPQFQNTKII